MKNKIILFAIVAFSWFSSSSQIVTNFAALNTAIGIANSSGSGFITIQPSSPSYILIPSNILSISFSNPCNL